MTTAVVNRISATPTCEGVISPSTKQRIMARAACQDINTTAAIQVIIPVTAIDGVIAVEPEDIRPLAKKICVILKSLLKFRSNF